MKRGGAARRPRLRGGGDPRPARQIRGLADSKVLNAERREVLAERIKQRAISFAISSASVEEIDRLNIFQASMLAMKRAVEALGVHPEEAWIDGNQCPRELPCRAKAFVDGDARYKPISAASILAKTARDAEMRALHERYPGYGFDQHKGYATAEHLDARARGVRDPPPQLLPGRRNSTKGSLREQLDGPPRAQRVRRYRLLVLRHARRQLRD
jgi:ribonuclease HII